MNTRMGGTYLSSDCTSSRSRTGERYTLTSDVPEKVSTGSVSLFRGTTTASASGPRMYQYRNHGESRRYAVKTPRTANHRLCSSRTFRTAQTTTAAMIAPAIHLTNTWDPRVGVP